jgi:hypothetical protein
VGSRRARRQRRRWRSVGAIDALAPASVDEFAEHLASDKARAKSLLERLRAATETTPEAA